MSENVLKKPVHIAILKSTHLQKLAEHGKLDQSPFGLDPGLSTPELPIAPSTPKFSVPKVPTSDLVKKSKQQIKLRVIHESIPQLPADKQPDCNSCKTAACCRAFVVNITAMEYESGLYGDAAVKLTPEMYEQLQSRFLRYTMVGAPRVGDNPAYFLEGKIGDACPFLQEDNKCGIYDVRPITCRTYSCVDDDRITQGMKDGTEPITPLSMMLNAYQKKR